MTQRKISPETITPRDHHTEQVRQLATSLADDPLRFIKICWPDMQIYDKQLEILLSVRDNIMSFVHAANETGKTRVAALVAIWFFVTRSPARVICSSSSESQLSSILFSEIQHLISISKFRFPLVVNHLSIRKRRGADATEVEPLDYLIGHVTNQVENLQGHHLPNDRPRVLAIFDEASAVRDEFFQAADSWAHRMLAIGNPLSNINFFYQLCKQGDVEDPAGGPGLLRKVIHIDGRDSPNVRLGMKWKEAGNKDKPPVVIPGLLSIEEFIRREQSYDEVQRTTRLYGQFYEGSQAMLFPGDWLNAAMDRNRWAELQKQPRQVTAIGLDVASGGRSDSCWTLIDEHGVIDQIVLDLSNTMEIVGRTIAMIKEHDLASHRVAIDLGGGKPIADRLAEQGYPVMMVGFGESANAKQTFKNRRAEMYGLLRERLKPDHSDGQFALPPDAAQLRHELMVLPLHYDSEGKLFLPPKSRSAARPGETSIEKLLGRSPDRADSLALAVWVLEQFKSFFDHSQHVYFDPADAVPLTPQEITELPDELRGYFEEDDDFDDDDDEAFFRRRFRELGNRDDDVW